MSEKPHGQQAEGNVIGLPRDGAVENDGQLGSVPPAGDALGVTRSTASASGTSVSSEDHLNTDDRGLYVWESGYPEPARKEIRFDAWIVGTVMAATLVLLLLTWRGDLYGWLAAGCETCQRSQFDRYAYFYLGGQLGGILFGVKYLYKVVARGRWSVDRRLWRFFSPFLSGGLALAIAALTESGVLGLTTRSSGGSAFFSIGFIAGYFADNALAKMQEIAETVFGSPEHRKPPKPPTQEHQ